MKVLVVGGNGFIGSHLVDGLTGAGHQVRVLDRAPAFRWESQAKVDYWSSDLRDAFRVAEALEGMDMVCHLAWEGVPATSNLAPTLDVERNLAGTLTLLEQMRKKGLGRILFFSSGGAVYGKAEVSPICEDHPLFPISSYGVVKVAIEKYLFMYQELFGFRPVILRPSNPYGPRQDRGGVQGFIATALNCIIRNETMELWGDGSVIRDFIYIDDLIRLCLSVVESQECGIFNVGSGKGCSLNEVLDCIRHGVGREIQVRRGKPRPFDPPEVVLDINRAMSAFSWKPKVPLNAGIQRFWQWLHAHSSMTDDV